MGKSTNIPVSCKLFSKLANSIANRFPKLCLFCWWDVKDPSRIFGLDLGGHLRKMRQSSRHNTNTCYVEFSCLPRKLVGVIKDER